MAWRVTHSCMVKRLLHVRPYYSVFSSKKTTIVTIITVILDGVRVGASRLGACVSTALSCIVHPPCNRSSSTQSSTPALLTAKGQQLTGQHHSSAKATAAAASAALLGGARAAVPPGGLGGAATLGSACRRAATGGDVIFPQAALL